MWKLLLLPVLFAVAFTGRALVSTDAGAVNNKQVTVTILTYQEIECPDDTLVPCPGDYYAKVAIGPHDFVPSPQGPTDTGLFSPYWKISQTVDRDAGRFVPIKIELHDDDEDGFNNDDHVDITGGADKTLDLTLDLDDGTWGGENGINNPWTSGAGDDPDARVLFDIAIGDGDFDDDGIPDGVERFGVRKIEDGSIVANLASFGTVNPQRADPCQKTILLEIDYMTGAADGHSHIPQDAALTELQTAYAQAPRPASANCPYSFFGFGTANGVQILIERDQSFPEQAVFTLDDLVNRRNVATNFLPARRPYFHYVVFAHDQAAGSGSGGLCCRDGRDLIVTLGSWARICVGAGRDGISNSTAAPGDVADGSGNILNGPNRICETTANGTPPPPPPPPGVRPAADDVQLLAVGDSTSDQAGRPRDQSATIMHELGHAMGLEHRGADEINNSPNYLSVMNYIYSDGPPRAVGGFQLDYSRQALTTIDESSLSEQAGIGGPAQFNVLWFGTDRRLQSSSAAGPVDWNRAGGIEDPAGCAGPACVRVDVDLNRDSLCVGAGGDGTLDTIPTPDDAVVNAVVVNGPNDRCETMPQNDDGRLGDGAGPYGADINTICIDSGNNNVNDSTAAADDVTFADKINSGPNQVCDTTASGDDVQIVPVGRSETRIHPGFDDWSAIEFRAALSSDAAGAGEGHPGDITYREKIEQLTSSAVLLDPDLEASKTVDKVDAGTGDTLTYTVKAKNIGTGDADNVKITDTLPNGTVVERTPPNIFYGETATETFTYVVPCGTADGTVLTNNVSMTATDLQSGPEANTANNTASASTTIHAPVLTLTKSATATVNAGEAITYTLTYANTGSGDAASVVITDTIPADVYYSIALDLGAGPKPGSVTLNADGTRTLRWAVGAVAKNSGPFTITYTARPTLLALAGRTFTNNASLTFTDSNGCSYPPVTASATTTITVVTPSREVRTLGFWGEHPELWSAELRARIQATDQRYDGIDGTTPNGALSAAEVSFMFLPGGNQPKVLQMQLLATYFNLADRRINAGTSVRSKTATKLGITNVRDAALFSIGTLNLPVINPTKARYSDSTTVLDEINAGRSPVW